MSEQGKERASVAASGIASETVQRGLSRRLKVSLAVVAMLLPSLTLIPLGGLYLFEHGWLLWWAGGALLVSGGISLALSYAFRSEVRTPEPPSERTDVPGADPLWSDRDIAAWQDVRAMARRVDVNAMTSADYFLELGQQTLNTVANRLHAEKSDVLWQFTLPEALGILERVSRRLGTFVVDSIPFGDRLTVAQFLAAYRWRGALDVAERAYDIWRIVRLVNPATAVTNEARERLSRAVYNYGKEHVARRIAEAYVEEVGRAAIDLYGGRLKIAHKATAPAMEHTAPSVLDQPVLLNVAVGGRSKADRAALAALAARAVAGAALSGKADGPTSFGLPVALKADASDARALLAELESVDVLLWVLDPEASAAERDRALLERLRAAAVATPALITVDLLSSDNAVLAADAANISRQLGEALGTSAVHVVINELDLGADEVASDLRAALERQLVPARRVHLLRDMQASKQGPGWARSALQAAKAAGALTRAVVRRRQGQ